MVLTSLGILDPEYHSRLIQDVERICLESCVPVGILTTSATKYCSAEQLDWLKAYKAQPSLCIVGSTDYAPDTQMMALAAALIRNYVDARVVTLHRLFTDFEDIDPTVLFIPNLFTVTEGKSLTAWQSQLVLDILSERRIRDKKTVIYVENMDALSKAYGKAFARHITENYLVLGV